VVVYNYLGASPFAAAMLIDRPTLRIKMGTLVPGRWQKIIISVSQGLTSGDTFANPIGGVV